MCACFFLLQCNSSCRVTDVCLGACVCVTVCRYRRAAVIEPDGPQGTLTRPNDRAGAEQGCNLLFNLDTVSGLARRHGQRQVAAHVVPVKDTKSPAIK